MPTQKFEKLLQGILRDDLAAESSYYRRSVEPLEEAGVATEERGLVITMSDGSEYQIKIVASRGTGAEAWIL